MPSEISKTPYAVPRRVASRDDESLVDAGEGLSTVWMSEASHFPEIGETSSFPAATSESMSVDLPIVPITITCEPAGGDWLTTGFVPVTASKSPARQPAAMETTL